MPRNERATEQADHLDRYWDAVILTDLDVIPDHELDSASARVVRHVETGGTVPDSREASERVWRSLQAANQIPTRANRHASPGDAAPTAIDPEPPVPMSTRHQMRRWPLTQLVAAAILLIFLGGILAGPVLYSRLTGLGPDDASSSLSIFRGGPARTGEQSGPGPAEPPGIGWQVHTGAAPATAPVVVDGVVYIGTYDRELLALDADRGTARWSFETEGAIGGTPAVSDGIVYVGDEAGVLYAVDAESGEERWRVVLGGSLYTASPVVVDGGVYLSSGAGGTAPAVVDGVVYVGGDGSASRSPLFIHAVDAVTGEERWRQNIGANGLFALDAVTGEERWHFATFAPVYHSSPAIASGTAYVGSKDGHVYAVNIETGGERWRVRTDKAVYASPAVVDGQVYIGSTDGFLYALDAATGQQRWRLETGVVRRSSAAIADGIVFVVGGNHLWAVDVTSGNARWRTATGGDGEGSPVVTGGTVYVSGKVSVIGGTPRDATAVLVALTEESRS